MADEIQSFAVVVPVGVSPTAPLAVSLAMPPRIVDEIHVQVPPGPRGEVGFQVGMAGTQVYPVTPGSFVVTDNETVKWPIENGLTSGAWQLIVYNTGRRPHTLWVRFLVRVPGLSADRAASSTQVQPLVPSDLAPAPPPAAAAPPPAQPGALAPPAVVPPPVLAPGQVPPPPGIPGAPALPPPPSGGPQAVDSPPAPAPAPSIDWDQVEGWTQAIEQLVQPPPLPPPPASTGTKIFL